MAKFGSAIIDLVEAIQPYCYVIAVVSLLVIGGMFAWPSEESHQKAKKALPFVVVGLAMMLGAVVLGKWFNSKLTFS